VLRQLRYTGGRRLSQRALATLLGTSRAHIARLELHGSPPLTDEQLDRLERAGDSVRPPFSRTEIDDLRVAMHTVRSATIEQANKAVEDIATRAGLGQIFPATDRTGEQEDEDTPPDNPFADSNQRPKFLTDISEAMEAAQNDIKYLAWERRTGLRTGVGADPDMILTYFGPRNPVDEAKNPEKLRAAIREVLRAGGTAEHLVAPPSEEASQDLVAVVPQMISYLGHGESRYQAHVIDESRHPLTYGICIAGDRGLLITRGEGGRTVAVRTNDPGDVAALRDLLRPYWENKDPIIEDAGRRTTETVAGHSPVPSVALPFEGLLTKVEREEGPRRLFKEGLSILNIPVAIHAWRWRAAELCTAGWIPPDLLEVLRTRAWELAAHGLEQLPAAVLDKYPSGGRVRQALEGLENYADSLQKRHAAWGDQLTRYQFWDACPKTALTDFITDGRLPPDEIPPACEYRAERGDVETIITRLITRLRSSRNYHLALIEDPYPFPQWFYFGVKGAHVLAQVFGSPPTADAAERSAGSGNDMLNVHIDYAPIAAAFAGWFDDYVLKGADPAWQDNHAVANWLEEQLGRLKRPN
jgi:transcriptional regulator with XRE-family HTH domain